MNSLFVNSLYIFDYKNKIAKNVNFEHGINIITSDKLRGNDVGKSILLKSIYHTLGADSIFDDKWQDDIKTYIVDINVYDNKYYVYRRESLFKVFNESFERLFTTNNRQDLGNYLSGIYKFKVMLPDRENEALEIAPPVYSYLINYIDQDKMDGTTFASFNSLGQYSKYKENVIYTHFGLFDDIYYNAVKTCEKLKSSIKDKKSEKELIKNMLKKVDIYLSGLDAPDDINILNIELEDMKEEYYDIVVNLQKIKNNLIKIRNEKTDLELNIKEIETTKKEQEKKWRNNSLDKSDLDLKITYSNQIEDLITIKDDLEIMILKCNKDLNKRENEYKNLLGKLSMYEEKMNINNQYISDVLKHKGYLKAKDDLLIDLKDIETSIEDLQTNFNKYDKIVKNYNSKKKEVNKTYENLMLECKKNFGLKEIKDDRFKNIGTNFKARGSNKPISTIIWYFNLLKVKYDYNKETIKFPLILDSPNNVELDDEKRISLFEYIFKNNIEDTQLIVSTLGFNKYDYKDINFNNIIELNNDKYSLLNKEDYDKNKHILELVLKN